jgi:flagellar hook assembly protein FlgD
MTLDFSLAERGVVTARVTDVRGRVVRTLSERWWDRGAHTLTWDGRSDAGSTAAAGVYFLVVKLNGQRLSTQKLQVLR